MDADSTLAARLARDVDAAFPALVAAHQDRLYTIALRLLGDPRDAEEVAQDALVRAYRAIGGYPPIRVAELRLRPWLASITVNLARNRRRRHDDRQPPAALEPMLESGFEPVEERDPGPAAVALRHEGLDALATLLLALPPAVRVAVVLRHVDGLSVAETAQALGRPEGTVKAQVARGLERLRQLIEASRPVDTDVPPAGPRTRTERSGAVVASARHPLIESRALAAAEVLS